MPQVCIEEPVRVTARRMGSRARPSVVERLFHQLRTDRIHVDVAERPCQVFTPERRRIETVLP